MGMSLKPSQSLLCNAVPWVAWAFGISSQAKEVSLEWRGQGPKWSMICKYQRPYESKSISFGEKSGGGPCPPANAPVAPI